MSAATGYLPGRAQGLKSASSLSRALVRRIQSVIRARMYLAENAAVRPTIDVAGGRRPDATIINDQNYPSPFIHERARTRLSCSAPTNLAATFLSFIITRQCQAHARSTVHGLRQTLSERLQPAQQFLMVPSQMLKLVGKIERRQDCKVDRINRLAAGTNCPNLLVDGGGEATRPIIALIAGNDQVLSHDLDRDAAHTSVIVIRIGSASNHV